jgi:hypothetical protein
MTILASKLTAATIALIASLGTVWIVLYWYACRPELFSVPAPVRIFIDGWIYILLGLMVYLATALTGLSRTKWYTTRIFGLCFATLVLLFAIFQSKVLWAVLFIAFGIAILLFQVIDTFFKREY